MDLIISHSKIDFDGLASMVAAQKLYPGAVMAFTGKPAKNVQEFLALYKDALDVKYYRDRTWEGVSRLIVVDTKSTKRVGPFAGLLEQTDLEVIVFDHHPEGDHDIKGAKVVSESLGATTTLFVERLIDQGLEINFFEATLLALGIYEDTGSLTFPLTSVRDVRAVAWLLEKGASLKEVGNFIERPLSEDQQALLSVLMGNARIFKYLGVKVLIAVGSVDEYVGGLDYLTQKLREIYFPDLIFTVVKMDDRVHIVARSSVDCAWVNEILEPFGGAGHDKAASATIKSKNVNQVVDELHKIIKEKIKPPITARDIMSAPVKTVNLNQSMREAAQVMLRYGHTGFPVTDGETIVGIISRRDVEKARHHGLDHAPVKGFMSWNVISITPDTPLPKIEELMIEKDIGRLPVIENGRLMGIISRTDVLHVLHGFQNSQSFQANFDLLCPSDTQENLEKQMNAVMPKPVLQLLQDTGQLADDLGYRVFLMGGSVRDLLLGFSNPDLDIVVEGDGISFADALSDRLHVRMEMHEQFATATLFCSGGFKIDVATARTEYYEYPAALPAVETGTLKQDLYRRDFTINAMALSLNSNHWGDLVDFFCGRADLNRKIIRVLYNLSFVEDPTRIFRGVRFEKRLGFCMEPETYKFALEAVKNGFIEKLSWNRIREEISATWSEPYPVKVLERLGELGIWQRIMPEIDLTESLKKLIRRVEKKIDIIEKFIPDINRELLYWLVLCHNLSGTEIRALNEKFQWPRSYREELVRVTERKLEVRQLFQDKVSAPSALHRVLEGLKAEGLAYFALTGSRQDQILIKDYVIAKANAVVETKGSDLKVLGLKPGPLYKELFEVLQAKRLDGVIKSKEEELDLINQIIHDERGD